MKLSSYGAALVIAGTALVVRSDGSPRQPCPFTLTFLDYASNVDRSPREALQDFLVTPTAAGLPAGGWESREPNVFTHDGGRLQLQVSGGHVGSVRQELCA